MKVRLFIYLRCCLKPPKQTGITSNKSRSFSFFLCSILLSAKLTFTEVIWVTDCITYMKYEHNYNVKLLHLSNYTHLFFRNKYCLYSLSKIFQHLLELLCLEIRQDWGRSCSSLPVSISLPLIATLVEQGLQVEALSAKSFL